MADPTRAIQQAVELHRAGRTAQALAAARRAASGAPGNANAHNVLGVILLETGDAAGAERSLRRAASLSAGAPGPHNNLGNALVALGRLDEAEAAYRRALEIDASYAPGALGLSRALTLRDRNEEAAEAAGAGAALNPGDARLRVNLGGALLAAGRVGEAVAALREAVALAPADAEALRQLVSALHYDAHASPEEVFELHKRLGRLVSGGRTPPVIRPADAGKRPLRVGYVSSDFRAHSVAFFIEPIVEHHDRAEVHVTCYMTAPRSDETTERIRSKADGWVDASRLSDEGLVRRVRADGIDVLVELGGHTLGNRLGALAARAAPVQATWIGYPATTGVPAIDARIVDSATDPEGAERLATERLVRLDPCFLCYRAMDDAPEVGAGLAESSGVVTFGSFNTLPKMGEWTLAAWAEVLGRVAGSRLVLKNMGLADARARERIAAFFESRGVERSRVELLGPTPGQVEHLGVYGRVDVGLDTFPYAGTTTTCEAMWMGVPVVSLAGNAHASRVGLSLLRSMGLEGLCAETVEGYVETAVSLAGDRARLASLRRSLRSRVAGSVLCDAAGACRRVESAYRGMWERACRGS